MAEIVFLLVIAFSILSALVFGLFLAGSSRWIFNNPQEWLMLAVFVFGLIPIGGVGEGSIFRQIVWSGLFLYCAFLAFRNDAGKVDFSLRSIPFPLIILVAYVLLSTGWSPFPIISIKRAIQVVGVLIIALAMSRLIPKGEGLFDQLIVPAAVFIVLGLLFSVALPGFALDRDNALRAFTAHKNTWGQFSLLASIVFLAGVFQNRKHRLPLGSMLGICILSLFASRSATSILSLGVIASIVGGWLLIVRGAVLGKMAAIVIFLSAVLGVYGYIIVSGELPVSDIMDVVYSATGKEGTLTGRTYLWQLVTNEIKRHPWFGVGYGGFWINESGAVDSIFSRGGSWRPMQAHNGYFDVVNELGFLGLSLLVFVLLKHFANVIKLYNSMHEREALFHGALAVSAVIINCSESSMLRTTHFWWVVLCVSIVEVHVRLTMLRNSKAGAAPQFAGRNS